MAGWRRSSGNGRSGTTISRSCSLVFSKGRPSPRCQDTRATTAEGLTGLTKWEATRRYLPAFLRAATITLMLSCGAMLVAVILGIVIATGRLYGDSVVRLVLTGYVELIRGTPLLLQLFVLYYGIAAAVRLPAFLAALLGLALNYAAYESEIYRSALLSVSDRPAGGIADAGLQ